MRNVTPYSIHDIHPCRCLWSLVMDPKFAALSEQYVDAEFLSVDTEECEVRMPHAIQLVSTVILS